MKKKTVKIEKTNTGYSAYYQYNEYNMVATTGENLVELFKNLAESTELLESALSDEG